MTLWVDDLLRFLGPQAGRILDLGCGPGANYPALAHRGPDIFGCEIDRSLLRSYVARTGSPLGCLGDGSRLPYRDAAFDAAVLLEVIEHLPPLLGDAILAECWRVVRPGGVVLVGVPTGYTERFIRRWHPRYETNSGHIRTFDRLDLIRTVERAGWAVIDVRTANLEAGVAWTIHAFLRSEASMDGELLEHRIVDTLVGGGLGVLRRVRPTRRLVDGGAARFGKSFYLYGRRAG